MPAARAAAVTAFCTVLSYGWQRTRRPVAGSVQGREALQPTGTRARTGLRPAPARATRG